MTTINISNVVVKTTSTRKYGKTFFSYGVVEYNGNVLDCGDPFPSSKFPYYEGVMALAMTTEGEKQISETQFRQCFKGIKNGANLYSQMAEFLEKHHNVNFI